MRRDEMKVVEQPFGCGRDEEAVVNVGRERAVGRAQDGDVLLEAWKDAARAGAAARIDREARGERERALLEPLDAEQLVAKRLQDLRAVSPAAAGGASRARSATYSA